MEDLPSDIQSKILSYIPCESVLECKLVSKTWNSLLLHRKTASGLLILSRDDCFWRPDVKSVFVYYDEILSLAQVKDRDHNECCLYKKFAERFKVGRSLVKIWLKIYLIGSCNGLVCLFLQDDGATVTIVRIFNPFTGECFDLPAINNVEDYMVMGFGYNPSGSNHKVVRIHYPGGLRKKGMVQIYTLGGDSIGWRDIGEINYPLVHRGTYWNGSIHWLAFDYRNQLKIAAFDLEDEEFRYLQTTPDSVGTRHIWSKLTTVLGGCLSIFNIDLIDKRTYIWSFKKKQKDNPSRVWSLEFSIPFFPIDHKDDDYLDKIPNPDSYEPIGFTNNNEVFLWYKTRGEPILCRYDPKTESLIKVMHCDHGHRFVTAFPHVNSLVSLKAMGIDSKTIDSSAECGSVTTGCTIV